MKPSLFLWVTFFLFTANAYCQTVEQEDGQIKIKHAEPVFNDFNTDLGANKGESQANVNFGYQRTRNNHHELISQLEIELAPANNFGLELLLPYNAYFNNAGSMVQRPENRLEFLQWSAQYTFYQAPAKGISMALGFTNTFESESPEPQLNSDRRWSLQSVYFYPFGTFAKNWNDRYFFVFSGGPEPERNLEDQEWALGARLNAAFHYGFSENDHYLGVELNQVISDGSTELYIRPQVILDLGEKFELGVAAGVPIVVEDTRWSLFGRLSYKF
jgi:hypothetical protein